MEWSNEVQAAWSVCTVHGGTVENASQPTLAPEFLVPLWHSSSHEVDDFLKHRLLDELSHLLSLYLAQHCTPGHLLQSPEKANECLRNPDRPTLGR